MATRIQSAWHREVAHKLGLPRLDTTESQGGMINIHLPCTTCPREIEFQTARRLPPEPLSKKLKRLGWDLKPGKIRCPSCVAQNRKTPIHREQELPPPPPPTLQEQIKAAFTKKEELPVQARMAIDNTSIRILIPKESSLKSIFVGEDGKSKAYWRMECITPGIGLDPQIMFEKVGAEKPAGKLSGVLKGSTQPDGSFILQVSKNLLPKGMEKFGTFQPSESQIISQSDDRVVFAIPENRKQTGKLKIETPVNEKSQAAALAPPPPVADPAPSKPIEQMKPAPAPEAEPKQERPTITIEQAINAINKFKESHSNFTLKLNDQGFLGAEMVVTKKFGAV